MVEPVSNTTVSNIIAGPANDHVRQGVENTVQDRDVSKPKKEAETNKDKQREEQRLAALAELQEEILNRAGIDNAHMRIREDHTSGRTVYETVDNDTGEVVKQYPVEEVLRSIRYLRAVQGLMVDRRA